MKLEEKTVRRHVLYEGKILTLRRDEAELPDGSPCLREVVEHCGGVGVLAVGENVVYLVRQYRYPYGEVVAEIPAGKIDPGEQPEACGRRELREETGLEAEKWTDYGSYYPSPGYTNEVIRLYLAERLTQCGQRLDSGEFLNVERVPLPACRAMLERGEIRDAKTVIALQRYFLTH